MSGVNDIQYVQLTQEDLDEVLHLLAKEFYPRESLSKGTGDYGELSRTEEEYKIISHCLVSGVSVGARDKATGSLVGVRTSYITTPDSKLKTSQEQPKYSSDAERNVLLLLEKAKDLYDVFQDPDVNKVLDFDRLCVHTDYCRRGIARKMVEMSMDLAAKKGCQLACVLITSPYSEKLFLRLGFQIKAELDLHDKDKDMLDLSLMDYKTMKVMTQRL